MNLIDNCVKEVLEVRRIITDELLCFEVDIIDSYNQQRTLKTMYKSEVNRMINGKYSWSE